MKREILKAALGLTLTAFLPVCAKANVTMPAVLSDHMVIQRGQPVHIWGTADPQESVTVQFRGDIATTSADALGRWSVFLAPGGAGGPFTLTIEGKNTITWKDVLVGDVWIASGQSNMEFPMEQTPPWRSSIKNMQEELAAANYPTMRLLHIEKKTASYPMTNAVLASPWTACTPQSVAGFSAVAYFFGRELIKKEHVPIGLVEASWGGTPAESWTGLDALSADASLMPVFRSRAVMEDEEATTLLQQKAREARIHQQIAEGKNVYMPWSRDFDSWAPAALFNAMISPLLPMQIRGVIWYQGESNTKADQAPVYGRLFKTLIQDWRSKWQEGSFPFLYVQIANIASRDQWPMVREAQRKALSLTNTGMAVTIDIGEAHQIHPANKQEVGRRLGLLARSIAYGENIEDSGPLFRQAIQEGPQMRIWFDHAASGLVAMGGKLTGFEVAGTDGKFVSAEARVEGQTIVVSSKEVATPFYVRYGWAANPVCNLFNRAGLPASPFSSK